MSPHPAWWSSRHYTGAEPLGEGIGCEVCVHYMKCLWQGGKAGDEVLLLAYVPERFPTLPERDGAWLENLAAGAVEVGGEERPRSPAAVLYALSRPGPGARPGFVQPPGTP